MKGGWVKNLCIWLILIYCMLKNTDENRCFMQRMHDMYLVFFLQRYSPQKQTWLGGKSTMSEDVSSIKNEGFSNVIR